MSLSQEIGEMVFAKLKTFFAKLIFSRQFFFCSERFPFSKIPKKSFGGKKSTQQKSFLTQQKKVHRSQEIYATHTTTLLYEYCRNSTMPVSIKVLHYKKWQHFHFLKSFNVTLEANINVIKVFPCFFHVFSTFFFSIQNSTNR